MPYGTFDAQTRSRYSGARGDYYYEMRTVTVNVNGRMEQRQEQVRKISWRPVSGRVERFFDDVLVLASQSLPRAYTDALAPWDLTELQPYSADYLAGFASEGYTVSLADGQKLGQEEMQGVIVQDVRRDIGGDEQRIQSLDTEYSDQTFKHILLPVWMAAYKYNGKSYRFLVNGQTGEVQGERPYSWWKIGFTVVLVAALVFGAVYLSDPEALGLSAPSWMD